MEAEEEDERVAVETGGLAGLGVLDRDRLDGAVAVDLADLGGTQMRTLPSSSSRRASFTDVSSARKRSRRWTSVIGRSAVSCRPSVQSSAESPPPTMTQSCP